MDLGGEDVDVVGITADSRQVSNGTLFVALVGQRWDGHELCRRRCWQGRVRWWCSVVCRSQRNSNALD